jgi:predicted RNA-binding Zn-ribbon protein involved in translation (DUF1610 family)
VIRTPDGTVGKRAKCPHCGELTLVPGPQSAAEPAGSARPALASRSPQASDDIGQRIEFPCPACKLQMRTPAAAAGKRGKCPNCGATVQIPRHSSAGAAGDSQPAPTGSREPQRSGAVPNAASITATCPACGKRIRAAADAAGKTGRCPQCGGTIQIPRTSDPNKQARGRSAASPSRPAARDAIPGLTPLADFSPGLTPLEDPAPGLTPLGGSDIGLTPLADSGPGLTPLDDFGGLTPLGDLGGLTPLEPDPLASPFAGPPARSVNPYQTPSYAPRRRSTPSTAVVTAPAIAMMILTGLTALFMIPYVIVNNIRMLSAENPGPQGVQAEAFMGGYIIGTIMITLVLLAVYALMFVGAWRMMQLRNWGLALTSAILMLMPCTICWLGLPVGIWAIVVLSLQSTRDQFS